MAEIVKETLPEMLKDFGRDEEESAETSDSGRKKSVKGNCG